MSLAGVAGTVQILLAETANPSSPIKAVPDNQVTPGWIGFLAIFFVGLATVLLIVDMTRRVRRTRYRGEVREQIALEREEAAQAAAGLDDELRDGGPAAGPPPASPRDPR
jgi:hypothetical protein